MRLFLTTVVTLFVCSLFFLIIKFWGLSQRYIDYKHPFYAVAESELPVLFYKPNLQNAQELFKSSKNLFLDIAVTLDEKLVIVLEKKDDSVHFRSINFADLNGRAVAFADYQKDFVSRKIILNLIENPVAGPTLVLKEMTAFDVAKQDQLVITSPYEPPLRDMKEKAPTYLYGASQPEILRLKSFESFHLLSAVNYRADIVIYTLNYYKHPFFTAALLEELGRRYTRIIIGPMPESEKAEALKIHPFGIILL